MKPDRAVYALLICLALPFAAGAGAEMVVQTCFSPQGRCSAHLLREIGNARKEILVAVYAFTSDDLAWALVKSRQRGVSVQVILDRQFDAGSDSSKGLFLEQRQVAVRRVSGSKPAGADHGSGLMHQKFAVIDRRLVVSGSYNWTRSADTLNDENMLLFRDAGPLAEDYRKAFFQLWESGR